MKSRKIKNNNSKKNKKEKAKIKEEVKIKTFLEYFFNIKYPEEVELIDELNEVNKEIYEKWLYKKNLAKKITEGSTLIIGVKGENGIVLGGDTKMMRGGETDFENKVKTFNISKNAPIIFASAGFVGVIEDFIEMFEKTLVSSIEMGKLKNLLSIKIIAEDLVEKVEKRYGPKVGKYPIHFILGGLSELSRGETRLYEIGPGGFGQKIKYTCLVGHGCQYARTIAKYLFPQNNRKGTTALDCNEIVQRIAGCIYWVADEIDNYVGGNPQIVYILNKESGVKIGRYNKGKIQKKVKEFKNNLKNISFEK